MFADAIELTGGFTRPVKFISRKYKESTVLPGLATMFFVNDDGWAITCRHVADQIIFADQISKKYNAFKTDASKIPTGKNHSGQIKKLELTYGFKSGATVQMKVQFPGSVSGLKEYDLIKDTDHDMALIHFKGFEKTLYNGHAVFARELSGTRPGDFLCRLGFPFPEFSDFRYFPDRDDIDWDTSAGSSNTPRLPIEGMFTRNLGGKDGKIYGLELSTPGLRGQSGGPLFNTQGIITGMQSATKHLHLGFDMIGEKMMIQGREQTVNNQPFMHVGHCINAQVIKDFLKKHHVVYYEGDSPDTATEIRP